MFEKLKIDTFYKYIHTRLFYKELEFLFEPQGSLISNLNCKNISQPIP